VHREETWPYPELESVGACSDERVINVDAYCPIYRDSKSDMFVFFFINAYMYLLFSKIYQVG